MKLALSAIALLASSASAFNAFSPKKSAAPAAAAAQVSVVSSNIFVCVDRRPWKQIDPFSSLVFPFTGILRG